MFLFFSEEKVEFELKILRSAKQNFSFPLKFLELFSFVF